MRCAVGIGVQTCFGGMLYLVIAFSMYCCWCRTCPCCLRVICMPTIVVGVPMFLSGYFCCILWISDLSCPEW